MDFEGTPEPEGTAVEYPSEIGREERNEFDKNSRKRKPEAEDQETVNKQPRLNPERKAKTNRPTWGHPRRTQVNESSVKDKQNEMDEFSYAIPAEIIEDPTSLEQALSTSDAGKWRVAIKEEMQ
ncbi:hypothetical protein QAD02_012529 [Eretmocerus hayati]|uniref:Uncharacterized protein n=1 Tax=Eretmocerus hayati TaxID=131215 RepID=A0ACC2P021_9HYME|nr:hypothetical protein QAD02_012529 [Eretmocerus hayati]